jgi:imidazolonepropionase-like amidohydrolase
MKLARSLLAVVLLLPCLARADVPGVYAITNGTVHTAAGPDIANGVVIIRNGLIEAAGANVAIPSDATVIDVKGAHVYPGLIDAQTSLGFPAPPAPPRRGGPGAPEPSEATRRTTERPTEPTPSYLAAENLRLTDADLDARRSTGVTTVVTAPAFGIFQGQSVVLNLSQGENASRIVRSPAALQVSFAPRTNFTYPGSLMGVFSYLRQSLHDAQQYSAARVVYDRSPSGFRRPETDVNVAALVPVLRRELPVVFLADSELMIRRAQALAREFNVRPIVSGARQGYRMPADLRDTPVLVSVKWPTAPPTREDREEQPLRVIRDRQLAPTTPSTLAKGGVLFALVSAPGTASDLIPGIRKAIQNGLSADDALRAVTISPARIFGVDRQLGSIERGKIANVIVADKPIFEKTAKVTRLFIDGIEVRPEVRDERGAERESPINGTWNLSVRAPQGNVNISVILRVEQGHVSGTFSGDRGSGEISGGVWDRPTLQFTIAAQVVEGETSDWAFRGTVEGDNIEGNVTTSIGTFEFSGSKGR